MTLIDRALGPLRYEQRKHDKGVDWAEDIVNGMSNVELLQLISDALESLLEERK